MNMTKEQLVELIESVGITAREDELYLEDTKKFPKIAYWEYIIEDVMASGDDYETVVTYQVSFASRKARPQELLRLKRAFNDAVSRDAERYRRPGMAPLLLPGRDHGGYERWQRDLRALRSSWISSNSTRRLLTTITLQRF